MEVNGRKGVGAPLKYSPKRVEIIIECIGRGLSYRASCKAAKINPVTMHRWLKAYPDFREAVDYAEVEREKHLVAVVEEGASKDWRAAKFLLECRHKGWSKDSKTTQDNRDLMDRLKIMEQALLVKINAIKVQQATLSGDDYDIVEILNEVHGIEENFDGTGLKFGQEPPRPSSGTDQELPEAETSVR